MQSAPAASAGTSGDDAESLRRTLEEQGEEIARLRAALQAAEREKRELCERGMRDASTGCYSRPFFRKHLADAVVFARDLGGTGAVVAVGLEGFARRAAEGGTAEAEEFAARAASFLRGFFPADAPSFRYETARLAWSLLGETAQDALRRAEEARAGLESSSAFAGTTVRASFSVLDMAEIIGLAGTPDEAADAGVDILNQRLDTASREGGGKVLASDGLEELAGLPVAYIVDPDPWHAAVLAERLESEGWEAERFSNGIAALEALSRRRPSVVVSELAVPQGDGFSIRRAMRGSAALSDVPFVLISDIKNAALVKTAADLYIDRYYQKPYFLEEIVAILDKLARPETRPCS